MRIRLFLSYLLVIALSLLGVSLLVRQSAQVEVRAFLGRGGLLGAESLVEELENWYTVFASWEGVEAIMPRESGQGNGQESSTHGSGYRRLSSLRLVDADGNLIYDPAASGADRLSAEEMENGIPLIVQGYVAGYLVPLQAEGQAGAQFEERFLERINHASLIAAAISGAASVVLAFLLAYFMLRPVNALVQATEKLADGDLSTRVKIIKPEELARLGETFNQMADALEESAKRRKALTADIAHELRTPLAVQRAHLEALMDGVFPMTEDSIATVLEQNRLLNRLVEDLRVITLTDSGELKLHLAPQNMFALVSNAVDQFSAGARERNIEIIPVLENNHNVLADAERIQQILHNLLQNGLRYTPEGGTLYINLTYDDNTAILTLRDTGDGIPEEALPYIFDRFYRAERSRSKAAGGTGLGLSIARNLAEAHQGSLRAANHTDGGAVFTLTLPLYQD